MLLFVFNFLSLHQNTILSMRKKLGEILIDIAKLVIGGVILAGLMRQDIPPLLLFTVGGIVAILMIIIGLALTSLNENKKNVNNKK